MTKYTNTGNKDTRSGFGEGLLSVGRECEEVVALAADLKGSVKMDGFAKEFPDRFFQAGIAEANMINVAAGLSLNGKIPFVGTFAAFAAGRVYDQVRMAVAYSETNVKIAASHAGITLGEDGATHQILEDIGLMRMLPGMTVIVPCDFNQTKNATIAAAKWNGPVYLRFGRPSVPNFTPENEVFEIGKAYKLNDGKDVTVIATGHLVWEALLAAEELEKEGVTADVINLATIKPLDRETILESVKKTGCVVTAEEHFIFGGMGEMIAGLLASCNTAPLEMVAINDRFGQSGTPAELMKAYGLDAEHIAAAARRAISRK
ncbi:MAG: transketolase family protein [Bacteroidales bacterium]|nr:transketolase family protein [Bacteroidales bacterium]MBQ2492403.1 transketolase family protein [Bacteroidales bacterium]